LLSANVEGSFEKRLKKGCGVVQGDKTRGDLGEGRDVLWRPGGGKEKKRDNYDRWIRGGGGVASSNNGKKK